MELLFIITKLIVGYKYKLLVGFGFFSLWVDTMNGYSWKIASLYSVAMINKQALKLFMSAGISYQQSIILQ